LRPPSGTFQPAWSKARRRSNLSWWTIGCHSAAITPQLSGTPHAVRPGQSSPISMYRRCTLSSTTTSQESTKMATPCGGFSQRRVGWSYSGY